MLRIALLLVPLLFVVACDSREKVKPELAAVDFFNAIYNEKNLARAKTFASEGLVKELSKYKSAKHFARQYLYLSFDEVKVDAALGEKSLRKEFYTNSDLTVLFNGIYNDKRIKEIRKVHLIEKNGKWYVDKIFELKSVS